jgi:hypothetical protein
MNPKPKANLKILSKPLSFLQIMKILLVRRNISALWTCWSKGQAVIIKLIKIVIQEKLPRFYINNCGSGGKTTILLAQ